MVSVLLKRVAKHFDALQKRKYFYNIFHNPAFNTIISNGQTFKLSVLRVSSIDDYHLPIGRLFPNNRVMFIMILR